MESKNNRIVAPEIFDHSPEVRRTKERFGFRKFLWLISVAFFVFVVISIILSVLLILNLANDKKRPWDEGTNSQSKHYGDESSDYAYPKWPKPSINPLGKYFKAAVAADNVHCSEIGRNILLRGGNAVDSAIATTICTGALVSHSSGLGGGHFMTIYDSSEKSCIVIDARETAPLSVNETVYVDNSKTSSLLGWTSIGVPGELHGLWTAFKLKGSGVLTWASLLEPTIDLLTNGYPVSTAVAHALTKNEDIITEEPTMKSIFWNEKTGKIYEAGEIIKFPKLAQTLKSLATAADPAELFYNGSIGRQMVREFQEYGAFITAEDLQRYRESLII